MTMAEVRAKQPNWFSRKNNRFFNDVSFRVLHGKITHAPFLVRSTYAWTDMFGQPKRLHLRVNRLNSDASIGSLEDKEFPTLDSVKEWLQTQ